MPRQSSSVTNQALEWFTDREEQQKLVAAKLNAPESETLPILTFYGVGGVGKTLLGQRIGQMLRRESEEFFQTSQSVPFARLDFDVRLNDPMLSGTSTDSIYTAIRRRLNVPCPRFDLAISVLRHKEGTQPAPEHRRSGTAKQAYDGTMEALDLALSGIPFASFVAKKLTESASPALKKTKAYEYLRDKADPDLANLLRTDPQAIRQELAARLGEDLEENLPARTNKRCRAVVLCDTWEALAGRDDCQQSALSVRHWLEDLYRSTDSVLFVVLGRNQLHWNERNPDNWPESRLEQHYVEGLTREDADKFLRKAGVAEMEVREVILAQCSHTEKSEEGEPVGEPVYYPLRLSLSADIVARLRADKKPLDPAHIQLGAGTLHDLTERFLRLLPADEARWIETLAVALRFDRDAAERAYSAAKSQKTAVLWERFCRLSFAMPQPGGPWYTIHGQIRDLLRQKLRLNTARWEEDNRHWESLYQSRAETPTDEAAFLSWYHRWHLDPGTALEEWNNLVEYARKAQGGTGYDMVLHRTLLDWWEPLRLPAKDTLTEEDGKALISIGLEYSKASLGDRDENLRKAISCYESALRVQTKSDFPSNWAMIQNNLGTTWGDLPSGNRDSNLKKAISYCEAALSVQTEFDYPTDWAMTQNNLGLAWSSLPSGNRDDNLKKAISYYEAALRVYNESVFSWSWAGTQNNLGLAWSSLPSGDRDSNLKKAILCYEAALKVYTESVFPIEWAMTQNNLGTAWNKIPSGDRDFNLKKAILCYEAALRVYNESDFPMNWTGTQNNLGVAWSDLPSGDRNDNLKKAISYYESTLRVRTETTFPMDWAATQTNLGLAWIDLSSGNGNDNLKRAISCYESALRVYNESASPKEWVNIQNNLGLAWNHLSSGNRDENLTKAISCYEAVLRVCTESDFPVEWAMANFNMGFIFVMQGKSEDGLAEMEKAVVVFERIGHVQDAERARAGMEEIRKQIG